MKECPNRHEMVHDLVATCPGCGGTGDESGLFSAPADAGQAPARPWMPATGAGMTPLQLHHGIPVAALWGALMAGVVIVIVLGALGLVLGGVGE